MKRGVFAAERYTLSKNEECRNYTCHLWPDGMRWNFSIVGILIIFPLVIVSSYGHALLYYLFLSILVPVIVYGLFRLPVLDFLKEGMPDSVTYRVERFPFRTRYTFVLCLLLFTLAVLIVSYPQIQSYVEDAFINLKECVFICHALTGLAQRLTDLVVAKLETYQNKYCWLILMLGVVLIFWAKIILTNLIRKIAPISKNIKHKLIKIVLDGYHLFIPPIKDHGDTVFYSPQGSIKGSLIRLALIEFFAKEANEINKQSAWTSRSFFRYLFFWCAPVWGGYLTLWFMLAPYLLTSDCKIATTYKAALYFSALLWMCFSAIFLWTQAQKYNQWTLLGKEDEAMLPPVLFGKLKARSIVAEMLIEGKVKLIIQVITGVALTLYWTILRYAIDT